MAFKCPKCGHNDFGSNGDVYFDDEGKPKNVVERHCHGKKDGKGCGFRWMSSDDSKYFSEAESK